MANTVSSKKRIRQNEKRNLNNKGRKSAAKTQMKKVLDAVEEKDPAKAKTELSKAFKLIDKCGKHNTWHPKKAGHLKSSLAKKVKSLD